MGSKAMKIQSLGPHTYMSKQVHSRHHQWLTRFTPGERHQLIEEDCQARRHVFGIVLGAILAGLVTLLITLLMIS